MLPSAAHVGISDHFGEEWLQSKSGWGNEDLLLRYAEEMHQRWPRIEIKCTDVTICLTPSAGNFRTALRPPHISGVGHEFPCVNYEFHMNGACVLYYEFLGAGVSCSAFEPLMSLRSYRAERATRHSATFVILRDDFNCVCETCWFYKSAFTRSQEC